MEILREISPKHLWEISELFLERHEKFTRKFQDSKNSAITNRLRGDGCNVFICWLLNRDFFFELCYVYWHFRGLHNTTDSVWRSFLHLPFVVLCTPHDFKFRASTSVTSEVEQRRLSDTTQQKGGVVPQCMLATMSYVRNVTSMKLRLLCWAHEVVFRGHWWVRMVKSGGVTLCRTYAMCSSLPSTNGLYKIPHPKVTLKLPACAIWKFIYIQQFRRKLHFRSTLQSNCAL